MAISHETSVCSTVQAPVGGQVDHDFFTFRGKRGEKVVLTLKPSDAGGTGSARLRLYGTRPRSAGGPLPLQISATLSFKGTHTAGVAGGGVRTGCLGDYCVSLRSGAGAYTTFARASSVE